MDGETAEKAAGRSVRYPEFRRQSDPSLPGGMSALMHRHDRQDELIFVLEGRPTLATDRGEFELQPGVCAGFPARGIAHHLINRTASDVVYLEIGDRSPGDSASYPNDDLVAGLDATGAWQFLHKDGRPY
jgi:uncharacterized cupin superfamily protein